MPISDILDVCKVNNVLPIPAQDRYLLATGQTSVGLELLYIHVEKTVHKSSSVSSD